MKATRLTITIPEGFEAETLAPYIVPILQSLATEKEKVTFENIINYLMTLDLPLDIEKETIDIAEVLTSEKN